VAVVELWNIHPDKGTEEQIWHDFGTRGVAGVWPGAKAQENEQRLCDRIKDKVVKYKELIQGHRIPFVVAVAEFLRFGTELQRGDLEKCLHGLQALFALYPLLSGVLYFVESHTLEGQFLKFEFIQNPNPTYEFSIPNGRF
jgi:hypothetical protein